MTYCRHCRRDRSLDEQIPLHMLLLMFLVLVLVLLWGDAVRRASAPDCGDGSQPAARTNWPPAFRVSSTFDTYGMHGMHMHDAYGLPEPALRP